MLSSLFRAHNLRPALLAFLVCALLVACTLTFYGYSKLQEHERIAHSFDQLAQLKAQRIQLRVEGYLRTLLDLRGLFVADPSVSESEFQRYLQGVDVAQRYPTLLRIGYAPRVTPDTRAELQTRVRRLGPGDFVAAAGDFPILYSFPSRDDLVGQKLNEGELRSHVLDQARDSNLALMSPQMALRFQADGRSGFVAYVPLYGNAVPPGTLDQRRQALSGYLFAAFLTADLVESTIGPDLERLMGLSLYDGPASERANLAYDSGHFPPAARENAAKFISIQRIEIGGRPWTFVFHARPAFIVSNASTLPIVVLVAGLLTSVLAARLAYVAARRMVAEGKIRYLAFHDELTGLPNRARLRLCIQEEMRRQRDSKLPCTLMIVELVRFREINYTLGHVVGDEVLKQAAARLRAVADKDALVTRISNEQFGILLPNSTSGDAIDKARVLVRALEEPLPAGDSKYELGAHAGIASVPDHAHDADDLIRHADIALNLTRGSGAEYAVYDPGVDPYKPQRLALLGAFRQAVRDQQLQLYCQPKADLRSGRITSVEALVRWQHPEFGLLTPDKFISLIEPTELIQLLTQRMLEAAMRQCAEWRKEDLFLPLAVNLSTRNLLNPALPDLIGDLMHTWGADASWVGLEITESSIMDDPVMSLRVLNQLHAMGIKLYVDDFGTGYSSLSYLMKLPVSVIKIDPSFTMNMLRDPDVAAIVKGMIELAHNMRMTVVAEGVASREIWDALVRLGCDEAQGYYISPPIPAQAFSAWLEQSEWQLAQA